MAIIGKFEAFAAEFEAAVQDDDWSRLEQYLSEDATYLNVGGPSPDPKSRGRTAVIAYLQTDVSAVDRRFDYRELVALTPPVTEGNRLSRRWRCTYRLAGTPDLVVEGKARYLFEGDLIKDDRRRTNHSFNSTVGPMDGAVWKPAPNKAESEIMNTDRTADHELLKTGTLVDFRVVDKSNELTPDKENVHMCIDLAFQADEDQEPSDVVE